MFCSKWVLYRAVLQIPSNELWLWYVSPAARVIQLCCSVSLVWSDCGCSWTFSGIFRPCALCCMTQTRAAQWHHSLVCWSPAEISSLSSGSFISFSFACSWDSLKVRNCSNVPTFAVSLASAQQMKHVLTSCSLCINQNDWCDCIASSMSDFYRSIFAFCS